MNTIKVILSLATNLDWSLHQLDAKNAFLNGDLEDEVYLDIRIGFGTHESTSKVCKLQNFFMVSNNHLKLGLRDSLVL